MITSDAEATARRRTLGIAATVLVGFGLALLLWIAPNPSRFVERLGIGTEVPFFGWVVAVTAAAAYTAYSLWAVPAIRTITLERSWFRSIGIPLALLSGVVEEMFFRHVLMDWLAERGSSVFVQIVVSAFVFATVHGVWGVFGRNWKHVVPVLYSTFGLGLLMSLVYLASDRIVLPAVLAHIAINLVIEPGLLLNAARLAGTGPQYHSQKDTLRS